MSGPNTQPTLGRLPIKPTVRISTANTNADGTGTLGDVYAEPTSATGGDGSRLDKVAITATGVTTAGMIRFFDYDGTNNRLLLERPVTAVASPGATTKRFADEITRSDGLPVFVIPPGHTLRVSTHNAETFDVAGEGWRY